MHVGQRLFQGIHGAVGSLMVAPVVGIGAARVAEAEVLAGPDGSVDSVDFGSSLCGMMSSEEALQDRSERLSSYLGLSPEVAYVASHGFGFLQGAPSDIMAKRTTPPSALRRMGALGAGAAAFFLAPAVAIGASAYHGFTQLNS